MTALHGHASTFSVYYALQHFFSSFYYSIFFSSSWEGWTKSCDEPVRGNVLLYSMFRLTYIALGQSNKKLACVQVQLMGSC